MTNNLKMKINKFQLLFLGSFLMFLSSLCNAQDTITMKDGDKMNGRIITVGAKEIELRQAGNDTGIIYIGIADIFTIKYPDGRIDTTSIHQPKADTNQNWYFKGVEDADSNYRGGKYGPIMFFSSLIATPVLALYPAIACSKRPPSADHLNIRDNTLLNNPQYMKGYKDEAFDIKTKKVWRNYIAGSVICVALALFFILY
jgi:hypothetical protein